MKQYSRLPEGYQEVEYIQPNNYVSLVLDKNTIAYTWTIVAEGTPVSGNYILLGHSSGSGNWVGETTGNEWSIGGGLNFGSALKKTTIVCTFKSDGIEVTIDGVKKSRPGTATLANVVLFGTSGFYFGGKLYSAKCDLFDIVPCYQKSDNAVGIYDLVGKKFYLPSQGSLSAGPDVFYYNVFSLPLLLRRRAMMVQPPMYSVYWNQWAHKLLSNHWSVEGGRRADWQEGGGVLLTISGSATSNNGLLQNGTLLRAGTDTYITITKYYSSAQLAIRPNGRNVEYLPKTNILQVAKQINTLSVTSTTQILNPVIKGDVGDYSYIEWLCYYNVTQMFGAGNEPTDVAAFEAWLAENNLSGYQPYNKGEIIKTTKPSWIP